MLEPALVAGAAGFLAIEPLEACLEYEVEERFEAFGLSIGAAEGVLGENLLDGAYLDFICASSASCDSASLARCNKSFIL
jgi:hypothetical protein